MKLVHIILLAVFVSVLFSPVAVAAVFDGTGEDATLSPVTVGLVSVGALGFCALADKTVKMVRQKVKGQPGPVTADVNADEVGEYRKAGWVLEKEADFDAEEDDDDGLEPDELAAKFDKLKSKKQVIQLAEQYGIVDAEGNALDEGDSLKVLKQKAIDAVLGGDDEDEDE